MLYFTTSRN